MTGEIGSDSRFGGKLRLKRSCNVVEGSVLFGNWKKKTKASIDVL